jgi:hypothetical protein
MNAVALPCTAFFQGEPDETLEPLQNLSWKIYGKDGKANLIRSAKWRQEVNFVTPWTCGRPMHRSNEAAVVSSPCGTFDPDCSRRASTLASRSVLFKSAISFGVQKNLWESFCANLRVSVQPEDREQAIRMLCKTRG